MSPSDPPSRIKEPSVRRYSLLTPCCPSSPPPRLRWIDGSATLTTLLSRITMLDPRIVATSVNRFRDADKLCVEGDETVPAICPACHLWRGPRASVWARMSARPAGPRVLVEGPQSGARKLRLVTTWCG